MACFIAALQTQGNPCRTKRCYAGVYLFADLSSEGLSQLAKIAEPRKLPAGYSIFRAGDPATAFYLIKDGIGEGFGPHAGSAIPSRSQRWAPDRISGEMALVDGMKRSATAETLEPTAVLCFDYEKMHGLLAKSPATASNLYRAFARFLSKPSAAKRRPT